MPNPARTIGAFYRAAFGGLPAVTWLLCLAGFLNRMGSMVVPFLGLYLKERFGYSAAAAGLVVGLYGAGAFAGSWIGGRLTDRIGPVRLQVVALGSAAVWMLLVPLFAAPGPLALAVFVLGMLNDAFRPGSNTAAAISCAPEQRRKALALNRLALNLGWAFGPTIGGYLVQIDFAWMFVVDGATSAIAALWLATALRGWNPVAPPRESGDLRPGHPLRDGPFLWLMAANVLAMLAFMQYFTTGSRVLEDQGFTRAQIGWYLAINPIMITLFEMPVVHALRRRPALPLVAAGALLIGLGYLALLLPWGWAAALLAMVVVAGGELLQMPQLGAHVNDHAPDHARGTYNGVYGMTFTLALVLAPILGGALYDAAGAPALWCACALAGAFGAVIFRALHARR